jgi:hypothetical protein
MDVPRLSVQIRPSRQLAATLVLLHAAALACVLQFLPGAWISASAAIAILASLVFHLRRDALQFSNDAVTALTLRQGTLCELTFRNGAMLSGFIDASTFTAPLLTIILVRPSARWSRRVAILMPDSASEQELRQIRVWLRHGVRLGMVDSGNP